jgi:hypothetical protein
MASPATMARRGDGRRTVGLFVCLFCKQGGTLVRIKAAQRMYACSDCLASRGGLKGLTASVVSEAIQTFHQRIGLL